MGQFTTSDTVFGMLVLRGTVVANVRTTGLTSVGGLVEHIRRLHPGLRGMGTLSVRNMSQGWAASSAVYLR